MDSRLSVWQGFSAILRLPRRSIVRPVQDNALASEATVRIGDGRNSYLLADFVDGQLLGKIVTSDRP